MTKPKAQQKDTVGTYLREIGKFPLLSAAQEIELARTVQEALNAAPSDPNADRIRAAGQRAKRQMIEANLRLVVAVAKKYNNRGLDLLDLIQEGSIGLSRAVDGFDPSRGWKFSTYAYWWIRQGITRAISTQSRTIRLPVHVTEKLNRLKKFSRQFQQQNGRLPSRAEICTGLGWDASTLELLLQSRQRTSSLNKLSGFDQDAELGDLIRCDRLTPEESLEDAERRELAAELLGSLPDRTAEVVRLHVMQEQSLNAVGRHLDISRERVRQISAQGLRALRSRAS